MMRVGQEPFLQVIFPVNDKGLGIFGGVDLIYNPLKNDVKDDIEDDMDDDADVTHLTYINIPISAGLNYTYPANEKVSIYGNVGLTLDFLKVTEMTIEIDKDKTEITFDMSNKVGMLIGGGSCSIKRPLYQLLIMVWENMKLMEKLNIHGRMNLINLSSRDRLTCSL